MNELLSRPIIILVLSLALLIATGSFIVDIPDVLISDRTVEKSKLPLISNERFDIIDKALKENVHRDFFTFVGDFDNPFQVSQGVGGSNDNNQAPTKKIERVKLQLKGILNKEKPLAILEDERGMTYIRGVGDSITNQVVYAITGSKVSIIDSKGKYDIVVEEE
jgi:hypothetical protein